MSIFIHPRFWNSISVCVILGEIFISLLEHFCLITRIICQTKRTESLLMCPLSCPSMLRWPNYGGLRRGNYRPRNCHKSDPATNISMPSPTVGTYQKAFPAAQGSFFLIKGIISNYTFYRNIHFTFLFRWCVKITMNPMCATGPECACGGNGFYVAPNFERRQFWQKTASFLYFPQLWYLILSCFANCYRCCVNSIKLGQTPFFAAAPEAELAACLGQFSQSFQALRNKSSLPKGDSLRPFRVCT